MFKERLKEVGKKIGEWFVAISCIAVAMAIIFGLGFLAGEVVVGAILSFIVHGMVILVILITIINIYKFINWLFIEPYKVRKKRGR